MLGLLWRGWWRGKIVPVGLSLLVVAALASSVPYRTCVKIDDHGAADEQNEERARSIFPRLSPRPQALASCVPEFITASKDEILAVSTLFIALFTFTLWGATREMQKGADATLAHLQESSRTELRAYVSWYEVEKLKDGRRGRYFTFKNYGQTPAATVRVALDTFVGPVNNPAMPSVNRSGHGSATYLGPGQVTPPQNVMLRELTLGESALIAAGTHFFYLFGDIKYRDVFGEYATIEMCWVYIHATDMILPSGTGNTAIHGAASDSTYDS